MSFSVSFEVLPSFFNHHEIEFCRQLLLNQIPNALLFFDTKSKIIRDFLIQLLKIPGNDPIRDVPVIIFKWSCRCFFNRIKPPIANPSVPLDFSFVHPELVNFEILYSYVSNEDLADNFLRLNETFPYELFKVISNMKPENAQIFATACGFNSNIPIHMSGRIISIFPLSLVTIDFSQIFRKRCNKSYDNFISLFEGLLCNADFNLTQITAAQILSDHFDDLLIERQNDKNKQNINEKSKNNQCLQLINTSIRKMSHFLDNNFALSMHLFPSQCTTLSFLLQTSAAPFSTLSKAIKNLPPSEYITRFNNQMKLMQVIGLGENWKKLEEHSLPFLIGKDQLPLVPVILVDIPRTSKFLTLNSTDYQKDYDFIHTYLVIDEMIKNQKLNSQESLNSLLTVSDSLFSSKSEDSFYSKITTDLFSLLFLKKKNISKNYDLNKNDYFDVLGRRKSNSMSLFPDIITSNFTSISKSGSTNYLMKNSSSEFLFDADTAFSVVSSLLASGRSSPELQPYLHKSLIRLRCAMSLFERPVSLEAALLPHNYFYLHALTSFELLDMMIKSFGNPPTFVISRQFSLSVSRSLFLRDRTAAFMISTNTDENDMIKKKKFSYFNPFSDRLTNVKQLNQRTEEIFNEVLNNFPSEHQSLLLLDFVSSHKKFTVLAKRNKDKKYDSFVKKLFNKSQRYPHGSILDLIRSKSLNDLQKKLGAIMSFSNSSFLSSFCAFLFLLTSNPSQSFQNFFKAPIENQIIDAINDTDSIQSAVERFADTGIDVLKIILKMKNKSLLKEKLIVGLVNFDPLFGIPFSFETSVNERKIIENIRKKENFKIVANYLEKPNENINIINNNFLILNEKNKEKFKKTFEEKIDEIIHEDKVLLLLQKLNINNNNKEFQEKSMLILDYLLYKVNLSPYFDLILTLLKNYPKEWSIQFIETFVSLIDPSNETALFPLQQQLSELKPKKDFSQMNESLKVRSSWDYLIKEVTRFKNIIQQPEKFYRLCTIHLMSHEIGRSLITLVQSFTQILLFVRKYKIFNEDDENENLWIKKYLKYGISSLKESVLADMTIDIGLNYDYECGLSISKYFNMKKEIEQTSSICISIKSLLPMSINLINYAIEPLRLAEEILSEQVVKSIDDEETLLHLLVCMKRYDFVKNLRLYEILYIFTHCSVFLRFGIAYSGKSVSELRDVAEFCDLLNFENSLISLFDGIEVSDFARKKLNDCYSIFGLLQGRTRLTKKLVFSNNFDFDFNFELILNEAFNSLKLKIDSQNKIKLNDNINEFENLSIDDIISFINKSSIQSFKFPSFSLPNIFSLSANKNNLMFYIDPIQKVDFSSSSSSSSLTFYPDFKFFNIACKNSNGEIQLRISSDSNAAITETIAFSETKIINGNSFKRKFFIRNDDYENLSDFTLFNAVNEAVVSSSLFDLFDSLKIDEMKRILEFANERNLIYFLLQITIWIQENQDFLPIFVFPGSALELEAKITKTESSNLPLNLSSAFIISNNIDKDGDNQHEINVNQIDDDKNENNDNDTTNIDDNVGNDIKSINNDENKYLIHESKIEFNLPKILDFVLALKFTLINAIRLVDEVDPSALFSSKIIKSGIRKNLDDLCLAIEHQLQIGVKNLNLFEETASTGNVAHVIAQVFVNYSNDYDRGFALTRVFHADVDEVMIEAAALVATKQNNNEEQLVQFLLAVLPRLDSNSSSQLIQALSSILVRNASNEHFLKLIISGIKDPQSAYQMLRCFGYSEQARNYALLNNLGDEVELSMKDANKRGISYAVRICNRWILQHRQQTV